MIVVTPAQVDPRAAAFRVRGRAPLRFVLAVGDVGDTEVEEDGPIEELAKDTELDPAGDVAELGTILDDDCAKGTVHSGDDGKSCIELETTKDRGVDVVYDDGAERDTVEAINEVPDSWEKYPISRPRLRWRTGTSRVTEYYKGKQIEARSCV